MFLRYFFFFFLLNLPFALRSQDIPPIEGVGVELEVLKEFAPDFEMTMEDGTKKNLSDFKGQVLYLSFWASWCKPCINSFEKYREMRESIEDLGVVMLNVSIDESDVNWRTAIEQVQPTGIHAKVGHDVVRMPYQMYSVPLYEIVGKRGQFLYLSEDGDRDILGDFRGFLEE